MWQGAQLGLREIACPPVVWSGGGDRIIDTYVRLLRGARQIFRSTGFFSMSFLGSDGGEWIEYFSSGGLMQVISSPILDEVDARALVELLRSPQSVPRLPPLTDLNVRTSAGQIKAVQRLIAEGRLELRFARHRSRPDCALYHEKQGLAVDEQGDHVGFIGSFNETYSGLVRNLESASFFYSWKTEDRRALSFMRHAFRELWQNRNGRWEVAQLLPAFRDGWIEARSNGQKSDSDGGMVMKLPSVPRETLLLPSTFQLREHQSEAVKDWLGNRGRGILEMATGSGKTIAALAGAVEVRRRVPRPLAVVVVVPYQALVGQWREVMTLFGLSPIECAFDRNQWMEDAAIRAYELNSSSQGLASFVTTVSTLRSAPFQKLLRSISRNTLLIGDEVHHLGAPGAREALPDDIPFRLGLTATLLRPEDDEGNAFLQRYFDGVVARYTLREAIDEGILTPFQYFPRVVELTEEEFDNYAQLSRQISRLLGGLEQDEEYPTGLSQTLQSLLIRRARVIGAAERKLQALRSMGGLLANATHTLVYCGDGTVDSPDAENLRRQVDAATSVLGRELGLSVARYVAETPFDRREEILRAFEHGKTQAIVAIRCLDEGVDIPATRIAVMLASTSNPRQYVQRSGRVLRQAPGKGVAAIHDMLAVPPSSSTSRREEAWGIGRGLVRRELTRALYFTSLAENGPQGLAELLPIRRRFDLRSIRLEDTPFGAIQE